MKKINKIRLVAIATTAALVGGLLIMPVCAADSSAKVDIEIDVWIPVQCEKCGEDINSREEFENHICKEETEKPTEPEKPVEPAEPTEPEKPVEPTEPEETEKPVEPVTPETPTEPITPVEPEEPTETITITKNHDTSAKECVMLTLRLPSNFDDDKEITTPSFDIEKLETEAIEAKKLADEARAEAEEARRIADEKATEADRLAAIAEEKTAVLESAKQ